MVNDIAVEFTASRRVIQCRLCRALGCTVEDAEDAFEAAIALALGRRVTFCSPQAMRCWLYRVAYAQAVDQYRRCGGSRRCILDESIVEQSCGGDPAPEVLFRVGVLQAWSALPDRCRDALAMVADGYTSHDIAQTLDVLVPTAEKLVQRARCRFRLQLQQQGLEDEFAGKRILSRHRECSK